MANPTSSAAGRQKKLPLGLQPYHILYMGLMTGIVIGGTAYSLLYSTHTYNVMLSTFPSSLSASSTPNLASISTPVSSTPRLDSLLDSVKMPGTIFADRRNLLNRVFIKYAWAWTTVAFLAQIFTLRVGTTAADVDMKRQGRKASNSSPVPPTEATVYSAISASVLRYITATLLWVSFASWFLGPPIMDRIRHYSGAVCIPSTSISGSGISLPGSIDAQFCYAKTPLTPTSYPQLFQSGHHIVGEEAGGKLRAMWKGGHDISGHTYILILSSMYLLEELTPYLPHLLPPSLQVYIQHWIPRQYWSSASPFSPSASVTKQQATVNLIVATSILALVGIWCISLLFTSLFFHTPSEKFSGLLVGLAASLLLPKKG